MKSLVQYILESQNFLVSKHSSKIVYNYHPKTRNELKRLVNTLIKERGNTADLNDIDTSAITDMSYIFYKSYFNGDISEWDVSNVINMIGMFAGSKFTGENGDISNWDVSNVTYMSFMFQNSKFTGENGDISNWNVSNVIDMVYMFKDSPLQNNPPKWYKQ